MLMQVGALFEDHQKDIQSSIFYEARGVPIAGVPLGRAFQTCNFVGNLDRDHSAHGGTKDRSMFVWHLKRSNSAQSFSGPEGAGLASPSGRRGNSARSEPIQDHRMASS
jgi:hypothetical protein